MTVDSRASASSAAVLSAALSNGNDSNRLILTKDYATSDANDAGSAVCDSTLSRCVCVWEGGGGVGGCVRFGDAMAY